MPPIVALMNGLAFGAIGHSSGFNDNVWFRKPGYEIAGGLVPSSTAIGASDVSLELANAYTIFVAVVHILLEID